MNEPAPLLVLLGPTASGKTALSLALARRWPAEVISADSVQVYRYFDIGSGKLKPEERAGVPHHGLDLLEPFDDMDASRFGELATGWIGEIRSRHRLPIVCGGTFLWIRALVHGLVPAPPKDEAIRERHRLLVEQRGREALHQELARVDVESAGRLHPNDFVRVSRALEVQQVTGVPLSELQREHAFQGLRHRPVYVGIEHGPALAERIRARVEEMLDQGLVQEVEELSARGFADTRPMHSVGYRQVQEALRAPTPPSREALAEEVARAMRIFARRQRTWLREREVHWLGPEQAARGELPDAVRSALGL